MTRIHVRKLVDNLRKTAENCMKFVETFQGAVQLAKFLVSQAQVEQCLSAGGFYRQRLKVVISGLLILLMGKQAIAFVDKGYRKKGREERV